jgi:excisionase family DNA binding protein
MAGAFLSGVVLWFSDHALTVQEQVALLKSKGLLANEAHLAFCLQSVSYHRLSGYWHTFRIFEDESSEWQFHPNTEFDAIWDRYVFDRQLRLLVLDAIERVEVSIRNELILNLAVLQGPFGYQDASNFPHIHCFDNDGVEVYSHQMFLSRVRTLYKRELKNGNPIIKSFNQEFGDKHGEYLPYWVLTEILDFGTLCYLVKGVSTDIKKRIAARYQLKSGLVLDSWLGILRSTRNNCAHHGRFWNQRYPVQPILPDAKNSLWHTPVEIESVKNRAFGTLTILKYLMDIIAPQSSWADKLESLYIQHPNINRELLGYPDNWDECPIWSSQANKTFLTIPDVMSVLNVTQSRVSHLLRDGKLSAVSIGRKKLITKESLEAYLKTPRVAGRPKVRGITYHYIPISAES